jgi:hypothetical protein
VSLRHRQFFRIELPSLALQARPIVCTLHPDVYETIAPPASFTFAADAGSTFECALDAEPLVECQSPVEYPDLAPGDHTFTVVATDVPKTRSGNITRRLLRDIAEGRELGDVTTLGEPGVMKDLEAKFADKET